MLQSTHIGFLAQQLEMLFPDAVETSDSGLKSVSYVSMIPVLLEAIKEQQVKIV